LTLVLDSASTSMELLEMEKKFKRFGK
jgi:hypothetical protein